MRPLQASLGTYLMDIMSIHVRLPLHGFQATQFWGGDQRGICLQLTAPVMTRDGQHTRYLQFTPEQALVIAQVLIDWAESVKAMEKTVEVEPCPPGWDKIEGDDSIPQPGYRPEGGDHA